MTLLNLLLTMAGAFAPALIFYLRRLYLDWHWQEYGYRRAVYRLNSRINGRH